ncbi:MAG: Gfo/Idh/MocA family oxidoreductase [Clostridia bacterium]|nr:Gfo/Idh/MocA family oxidoreductase [Clostridia bacterium]NCC77863.1 Gfo/Idh/MocA family oxidoreductase [Clostridia bacterium]
MNGKQNQPIRVAFAGCGTIAPLHLIGLLAQSEAVQLVGLADPDLDAAKSLARQAAELSGQEEPVVYSSLDELIAAIHPDVVHILTPHFTHVGLACQALQAGCHVLLEKPAATQKADLEILADSVRKSGRQLGICLQNRYNFAAREARQLLATKSFGPVLAARGFLTWWRDDQYYLQSPWRGRWATEGGGLMINQAIHTLDLLLWLVDEPVTSVKGHLYTDHLENVIEVEDTASLFLRFGTGATGVFYATNAYPASSEPFLEVVCEKAILRVEGSDRLTVLDRSGNLLADFPQIVKTGEDAISDAVDRFIPAGKSYWGKSHAILIADFYQKIRQEKPFAINLAEGRRALEILLDLYEAKRKGQ